MSRIEEALAYMRHLESEPEHVLLVTRLAESLFDQIRVLPEMAVLDSAARERLTAAALLHDIGWTISPGGAGHHKASALLIQEHEWKSWSASEIRVVAQIARYHRRALPSKDHEGYRALEDAERREVCILASILRIADALDRRHMAKTASLQVEISDSLIDVRLTPAVAGDPLDQERSAAVKKSDLAVEVFGRQFQFKLIEAC